jgi:hypothetical protein
LPIISKILSIFLLLTFSAIKAQENYQLVRSFNSEARMISVDQLGNFYLVVKNNIIKYDRNGKLINQYSNQRYGEISSIDATDPYKIVVFYADFRIIILLDNQLSQNGSPIDMQFSNFDQPVLACRAYNTGIWMFDQILYKLYRLTLSLEVVHSSGNLTQILGYKLKPDFMIEYNNTLYVNNPESGILVFDQYGTYTKNIALLGLERFQVTEYAIFYTENQHIKKYNFKNLEVESLPLPEVNVKGLAVNKNRLFILTGSELKIYDYKEK